MIKVGINGFGRIGRMLTRALLLETELDLVHINDLSDINTLAHLFKYDSIHRSFNGTVHVEGQYLVINGKKIWVTNQSAPASIPWAEYAPNLVYECTGHFLDESAQGHLSDKVSHVMLSAPPKKDIGIPTIVLGVNDTLLSRSKQLISNASCTTNNAAPMLKILDDTFGIVSAFVTTVHSYTGDQQLHDSPHRDLRRARAAALSIIPTTTGAAKALTHVLPHLDGKIGGAGVRVPVPNGSLTDITCMVLKEVQVESVNKAFFEASTGSMANILSYTNDPIVSVDILDSTYSCLFDSQLTAVLGKMVKIVGWYDNETGYSQRLVDLAKIWLV